MTRRLIIGLGLLVAVAIVLAELLLRPAADDRWHLWLIIAGPAFVAAAITPLLARWVSSRASVAGVALTVALCSLALGAVSSSAASNAMFVSSHDYRLFLVVLLMSSGIALIVGSQLSRPLARDLSRLGQVAVTVTDGDLTVRTGISRADEVGTTALAIDTMVQALADAAAERTRLATARQHMLASIGHDLRTPLSAMRAAVESLEDGVASDPSQTLAGIGKQLIGMDAMLDQLIEFSRLESGHVTSTVERVSLAELADECVEALTPLASARRVRLALAIDGPAMVTGSPLELSRVLRNLVDNAVRHSPDDGDVTIAVGGDASEVRLSVLDAGQGFPADFRDRAFEPFHRADPSRNARTGNAGLGLAICRAIVESHGGTISLGNGPSGLVNVVLPASPPRIQLAPSIGVMS
ncbi:MAG: putative two-component histidine kinase [Ilumatobacteraceae bacterium]|nr:putative two-component histidine kinase [Ilumatobacteraceae bacterium]